MTCPSLQQLRTFLNGESPSPDDVALVAHVDVCPECQQTLEDLSTAEFQFAIRSPEDPNRLRPDFLSRIIQAGRESVAQAMDDTSPDHDRSRKKLPHIEGMAIERELGRGGMGIVYLATQTELGRRVAVKVLAVPALDSTSDRQRLQTESQAVARLRHPNIVQVYEFGEAEGQPYVVLEYIEGPTLAELANRQPQPARDAAKLVRLLADAVEHAHRQGVIHRDLKPRNILMDQDNSPRIADFGLARLDDGTGATHSGELVGTPSYMAPEQAAHRHGAIGPATDVYALGAILYELLVGRPPFQSESVVDTVLQVIHEDPIPPRSLSRSIPRDLETICLHCLRKNPNSRYASAAELSDDLQRFLDGRPTLARPASWLTKAAKSIRRHPARSALSVVAVIAVITMTTLVSNWSARREKLRERIDLAIAEARDHLESRRWLQSRTSISRARDLAADTVPSQRQLADLDSIASLEQLLRRLDQISLMDGAVNVRTSAFDRTASEPIYRDAFDKWGIQENASIDDMADRINSLAEPLRISVVVHLDDWITTLATRQQPNQWLVSLLTRVDGDPWRARLREATAAADRETLLDLAASREVNHQPSRSLHLLARALDQLDLNQQAVPILQRLQRQSPNDFWINSDLGLALWGADRSNLDDVILSLSVAAAIRPENAGAQLNVGTALYERRDYDAAERRFRMALDIAPDYFTAMVNLGRTLNMQKKFREAESVFRKAVDARPTHVGALAGLSQSLLRLQKPREAMEQIELALGQQPTDPLLRHRKALILMEQRKYNDAIGLLETLLQQRPGDFEVHFNLGKAYLDSGRYEEAVLRFQKAIELAPEDAPAHGSLGLAFLNLKKFEESIDCLNRALQIDPSLDTAAEVLADAKRLWKSASVAEPRSDPADMPMANLDNIDAALAYARQQLQRREYAQAISGFRRAVEMDPDHVPALVSLAGLIFDFEKDATEALPLIERALEIDPDNGQGLLFRGIMLWTIGQRVESEQAFRAAIESEPGQSRMYRELADRLEEAGEMEKAEEIWRAGTEALPTDGGLFANWGRSLRDLGRTQEAVTALRRAVTLNDRLSSAHLTLGALLNNAANQPHEALPHLRRAVELDPTGKACFNLAVVLQRLNQLEEAQKYYEQAVKLMPTDAIAHFNLGMVAMKRARYSDSEVAYREAIRIQPGFAQAHCNLGHALSRQKKYAEALPFFIRGDELGQQLPNWNYPSGKWVEDCRHQLERLEQDEQASEDRADF